MAQKIVMTLVSDLSGEELGDHDGRTVTFGLDGVDYEIDLSGKEADKFNKSLEQYVSNARRVGGRRRTRGATANKSGVDTKAVRAWAAEHGYQVSSRGRIPQEVLAAYKIATG